MGIKELENELENVLDAYALNAHNNIDNFSALTKDEQANHLPQAIDEIYKQNHYALQGFKNELMIYLKKINEV